MKATVLFYAFGFLCLMGCSSGIQTVRIQGLEGRQEIADKHEVIVVPDSGVEASHYQIIGKIFFERGVNGFDYITNAQILQNLKEPAQAMGGEALIGLHYHSFSVNGATGLRWASALVGRSNFAGAENKRNVLGVAILPPTDSSADVDSAAKVEENSIMVTSAQYYLEKAGYYALPVSSPVTILAKAIRNKEVVDIDTLGGLDAGFVLMTEGRIKGSAHSVARSAKAEIGLYLYSKETHSIVWEDSTYEAISSPLTPLTMGLTSGPVGAVAGVLVNLFDNARTAALTDALQKMLKTVKPPANAVISK